MSKTISGKVIIITGASSGIGRATALRLAAEGARLVLVARRENLLLELAEEIRKAGGSSLVLPLDMHQRDHVKTMVHSARDHFGRIDVLVNNAAFGYYGTVENTPADIVHEMFEVNFEAPLLASQLVIPIMKAQGSGHIINISSVAGKRGLPLSGIYSATKFAMQGISEALRVELRDSGIHVSVVSPGATESEFGEKIRMGDVSERFKAIGRVQTADEVAAAIVRCIKTPKAEVFPRPGSRLFVWMNAMAPSFVDKLMAHFLRERINARVSTST